MSNKLPFTGERFVPGTRGEIWIEHWHRYHFAGRWAAGKRVLDVACGEGYGSALLARSAAHVTGADISPQAVEHARNAYAGVANLEFVCAPCTRLPLADASVDVVVSFETLEHIREQREFIDEIARVLAPEGLLVMSCPNKLEYSDKRSFNNEFHVRELYRDELAQLVGARFEHAQWYGQRPTFFSLIAPDGPAQAAELHEVSEADPANASPRLSNPLYFLVVASRSAAALAAPAAVSVLADRDDWVHGDYEKVMKMLEQSVGHGQVLQREAERRDKSVAELNDRVSHLQIDNSRLDMALSRERAASEESAKGYEAQLAAKDAEIAAKDLELAQRRRWIWWLRLPLIRLGLLK